MSKTKTQRRKSSSRRDRRGGMWTEHELRREIVRESNAGRPSVALAIKRTLDRLCCRHCAVQITVPRDTTTDTLDYGAAYAMHEVDCPTNSVGE